MREAKVVRVTKETQIELELRLEGSGESLVETGFGLLDHFLTLIAFWARFDLGVKCKGDMYIDAHHTAEDVGLAFGQALREACGDRKGIRRAGEGKVPMDEALAMVCVDFSGRTWLEWRNDELLPPVMGGEEKDVWREFYKALSQAGKFNLHISFLYGKNGHHLLESVAKGLGLAMKEALKVEDGILPSTKGFLQE